MNNSSDTSEHKGYTHHDTWYIDSKYAPLVITLVVLASIIYAVGGFILHRSNVRKDLVNRIALTALIGHFIFNILVNSSSIHLEVLQNPLTTAHCWVYRTLVGFYFMFVHYSLFMYTVERLMFIRNPTNHEQKISKAGVMVLLALPWVLPLVIMTIHGVVVRSMGNIWVDLEHDITHRQFHNSTDNESTVFTVHVCHVVLENINIPYFIITGILFTLTPFLAGLIISIVALCMWCCYKQKYNKGTDYAMMGDEIRAKVRDSVIGVSLLNFFFLVAQFLSFFPVTRPMILTHFLGMYSIFGLVEVVIWLGTIQSARVYIGRCCLRSKMEEPVQNVEFDADDQDVNF